MLPIQAAHQTFLSAPSCQSNRSINRRPQDRIAPTGARGFSRGWRRILVWHWAPSELAGSIFPAKGGKPERQCLNLPQRHHRNGGLKIFPNPVDPAESCYGCRQRRERQATLLPTPRKHSQKNAIHGAVPACTYAAT